MFFNKRLNTGDVKVLNKVPHMFIGTRWISMVQLIDEDRVHGGVVLIKEHFRKYINSETIFTDNNPVLNKLDKSTHFTHILYNINHTHIFDPILLSMYRGVLSDDNHSNAYTRFLETIVSIYTEVGFPVLDTLLYRYTASLKLIRQEFSYVNYGAAIQRLPWIYLLPLYNTVYTELHMDLS